VAIAPLTPREYRAATALTSQIGAARRELGSSAPTAAVDRLAADLDTAIREYEGRPWLRRWLPPLSDAPRLRQVLIDAADLFEWILKRPESEGT
jgi:hypothetical protein